MHLLAIPYPAIDPVALQLGPLAIKWYGLAYMAGLLLGWLYIKHLVRQPQLWRDGKAPFSADLVDDLFIYVAAGVIVGGRLGHVLLYEPALYLAQPLDILKIWKGGMAFHGGMLGTILAMWVFARRYQVNALSVMDLVSAAVPIGVFFGRVANFINAEVIGRPTSVPWAMVFPGYGPEPRHPSQLYEAALEGLALFVILAWMIYAQRRLARPGTIGAAFLIGYGAVRTVCEFFKIDEYGGLFAIYPLTNGMVYSLLMVVAGAVAVGWLRREHRAA